MDFNLARGVDLHIIPTKQFKMNHVLIDFATPQTPTNATARNLLANLLETSTHRYQHRRLWLVNWHLYMVLMLIYMLTGWGHCILFDCEQVLLMIALLMKIYLKRLVA